MFIFIYYIYIYIYIYILLCLLGIYMHFRYHINMCPCGRRISFRTFPAPVAPSCGRCLCSSRAWRTRMERRCVRTTHCKTVYTWTHDGQAYVDLTIVATPYRWNIYIYIYICMRLWQYGANNQTCLRQVSGLGHRVWILGDPHFCVLCRAYSGARIGLLAVQCPSKPDTVHLQRARPRLLAGLHPVSGARLGSPAPVFPSFAPGGVAEDPEEALLQEL